MNFITYSKEISDLTKIANRNQRILIFLYFSFLSICPKVHFKHLLLGLGFKSSHLNLFLSYSLQDRQSPYDSYDEDIPDIPHPPSEAFQVAILQSTPISEYHPRSDLHLGIQETFNLLPNQKWVEIRFSKQYGTKFITVDFAKYSPAYVANIFAMTYLPSHIHWTSMGEQCTMSIKAEDGSTRHKNGVILRLQGDHYTLVKFDLKLSHPKSAKGLIKIFDIEDTLQVPDSLHDNQLLFELPVNFVNNPTLLLREEAKYRRPDFHDLRLDDILVVRPRPFPMIFPYPIEMAFDLQFEDAMEQIGKKPVYQFRTTLSEDPYWRRDIYKGNNKKSIKRTFSYLFLHKVFPLPYFTFLNFAKYCEIVNIFSFGQLQLQRSTLFALPSLSFGTGLYRTQ